MGKLATEDLKKLLGCIKHNPRVLVAPQVGYDAGVHRIGEQLVAVATDPCMGVPEDWFGYLLVHYAASDVSLFGAKPEFCTITLLGPRPTAPERFQKIMQQVCTAADELGVAIVRGHTGMYDSLSEMVGVCTTYGTVDPEKLITPGNAKPGDLILCTKPIGLETAVNYALTHKVRAQRLFGYGKTEELSKLVHLQSCVKEALRLAEVNGVHAMHDATEGGIVAALNEMAEASNVGFRIDWDATPFCSQAQILQKSFGLSDVQLLAMSSTGTILAAVAPDAKEKVKQVISQNGFQYGFIGEFTEHKDKILVKGKTETVFPKSAEDPYTRILSGTV
jgi:hydrogenase maturation factor